MRVVATLCRTSSSKNDWYISEPNPKFPCLKLSRTSIITKPATLQQSCALRFHHRSTTPPPNFFQPARRIGYWPEKWLTAKCSRLLPSLVKLSDHSSSELSNLIEWVCRSICPPLYVPRFFLVFSCRKPLQEDRWINTESERNALSNKCSQKENQREQEVPTFLWLDQGSLAPSHHNQFLHHPKR